MTSLSDMIEVISIDDEEEKGRGLAAADSKTRSRVARMGGLALARKHRNDKFYQMIGRRGGKARKKLDQKSFPLVY